MLAEGLRRLEGTDEGQLVLELVAYVRRRLELDESRVVDEHDASPRARADASLPPAERESRR